MQPSIYFSKTATCKSVHNVNEFNNLAKINQDKFTRTVNGFKVEDFHNNNDDLGYPMFYENGEVTMGIVNSGGHTYYCLNDNKKKGDTPDTSYPFFAGKIIPLTDGRIIITNRTGTYHTNNNINIRTLEGEFTSLLGRRVQMMPHSKEASLELNNLSNTKELHNLSLMSNILGEKNKCNKRSFLNDRVNTIHKEDSNKEQCRNIIIETGVSDYTNYGCCGKQSFTCGIF
jgi:hypothetical protein